MSAFAEVRFIGRPYAEAFASACASLSFKAEYLGRRTKFTFCLIASNAIEAFPCAWIAALFAAVKLSAVHEAVLFCMSEIARVSAEELSKEMLSEEAVEVSELDALIRLSANTISLMVSEFVVLNAIALSREFFALSAD